MIVSFLAGLAALSLVYGRRYEPARYCAAVAVAAIVAGWALARWPTILPGLTVGQAAAGHDTLVWVTVCVLVGSVILFPSLAFLFRLALAGRFQAAERPVTAQIGQPLRAIRRPGRPPGRCLPDRGLRAAEHRERPMDPRGRRRLPRLLCPTRVLGDGLKRSGRARRSQVSPSRLVHGERDG